MALTKQGLVMKSLLITDFFLTDWEETEMKLKILSLCVVITLLLLPQTGLTQPGQMSDLILSIEGPRTAYINRSVVYKIIIKNDGEAPAKVVELVETLPPNLDYVGSKAAGVFRPQSGDTLATVSWQFQEIPPKGKIEIELTLRAKTLGRSRNFVKLLSRATEGPKIPPLEALAELQVIGIPAMHISTYDTEDPVEVGKTTIYVIETRNEGTGPCTGISMTSVIPEEMEFVKCEGPGVACKFEKGEVLFETVPILAPEAKLVYKTHCKAIKPGSAKHRAILKYNEFTTSIIDEEGTSVYQ
jgi:uncharacterized repeat protein (TIGR01451 family)